MAACCCSVSWVIILGEKDRLHCTCRIFCLMGERRFSLYKERTIVVVLPSIAWRSKVFTNCYIMISKIVCQSSTEFIHFKVIPIVVNNGYSPK